MRILIAIALLCVWTLPAAAHQLSTAYLNLDHRDSGEWSGAVQWRLFDLQRALGLDENRDGQLRWGEVRARQSELRQWLQSRIVVSAGGQPCTLQSLAPLAIDSHYDEPYLVMPLTGQCPPANDLTVTYSALFDVDANHKLLVNASLDGQSQSRVVTPERRRVHFADDAGLWTTFVQYVKEGVVHILVGLDHLLFLCCLLLSCVLTRRDRQWVGHRDKRTIVWQTFGIVTAFTLAHAVTLTAATLGWIDVSSRWVEVSIAATVVLAALNNLWPLVLRLGWVTFGFGLLHGFGFASVLSELGLARGAQWLSIAGFNLGVELGQMMVIVALLPVLIAVRNTRWYRRYVMPGGSLLIAAVGLHWLISRL